MGASTLWKFDSFPVRNHILLFDDLEEQIDLNGDDMLMLGYGSTGAILHNEKQGIT